MRRFFDTPPHRGALITASVLALSLVVVLTLAGCQNINEPNTEPGAVESTGTVQAEIPEATGSVEATMPAGSTTPTTPPVPTLWPAKVGKYAKGVKIPVWFPKTVPGGFKIDTVDVLELDAGTGLICDIIYLSGEKALIFTQGSPKERSYGIVSAGKVPWGTDTAYVMYQDPEDSSSPPMIVYNKGGNFGELQGDGVTLEQLKSVAASMVRVK